MNTKNSIFSSSYWKRAAANFKNPRMLTLAGLIVALRVAVKFVSIPLGAGLHLSLDCYVNALGSLVYGPLVGLGVGAVSDTLGCIVAPNGPYFLPFILVEMTSSFLFGLFLWNQKLTLPRTLLAKFTVNTVCNIGLTSLFMKWEYALGMYGAEQTYSLLTLARIVKNLVLFPAEAILIVLLFRALHPALKSLKLLPGEEAPLRLRWWHILLTAVLALISVGLVLLYVFFLKDFVSAHNWKWM